MEAFVEGTVHVSKGINGIYLDIQETFNWSSSAKVIML